MTARIVLYGVDGVLLNTRQTILSKAGLVSKATSDIADVIEFLQTEDPTLLVVCSSVERDLRQTLLAAVDKVATPNLRKLVLTKHLAEDRPENTKVLQTPASPQTFISTVQQAMR
jgi:hypothetical protein